MYKIYINEMPLLLMNTNELADLPEDMLLQITSRYTGKTRFLLQHIDLMEKSSRPGAVVIHAEDLEALWKDFKSLYHIIRAAGGLVYNPAGEVLAIYRMGFWDLPKGKIEKKEKKEKAAVREVKEETGLTKVKLKNKLLTTYHTYRDPRKDRRVLKKTFWYRMTSDAQDLTPQVEEDIEKAVWMGVEELKAQRPIYLNILEVLGRG